MTTAYLETVVSLCSFWVANNVGIFIGKQKSVSSTG